MTTDFRDMLREFSAAGVEYLLVGAYCLAVHGNPRATGDMDLWVRPTPENAARVWRALERFGAPRLDLTETDLHTPDIVFQIGIAPNRIDLLTSIAGVAFDEAWPARVEVEVDGLMVPVLGRDHLLVNKRATGRPKDAADAAWLESHGGAG